MKKGLATIVMVLILAVISFLILIAWQSRLLLSIRRTQSLSDLLAVDYRAESEIYDWAAKFIGNYSNIYGGPLTATEKTLKDEPEPNRLNVTAKIVSGEEQLKINAARPYASTNMILSRNVSTASGPAYEKVEVILGLDCSGSMNEANRIRSLQLALMSFVDNLRSSEDADKFYLAMLPFRRSANWAYGVTSTSNNLDLFYNNVKDASDGGTNWNNVSQSNLCSTPDINICPSGLSSCNAETNLGASGMLAMDYFSNNPVDETKVLRNFVLFTDGLPNTSFGDLNCGTNPCNMTENNGACTNESVKYLKCSLAAEDYEWDSGYFGRKPDGVDVYAVTVANAPTNAAQQAAFDATMMVFNSTNFVKKAYANSDATQLSNIFDGIFNEIITSSSKLKIERIVPEPIED